MKKHLAFFFCLGLLLSTNLLQAQYTEVVYYEEDFGNGLNGWTSNAISTGADWVVEVDATSNGAFGTRTISSPTSANGALLFDPDYMTTQGVAANLPPAPYPIHNGEIISPDIDLSNVTGEASLRFYMSFRGFSVRDAFFSYSIDGGATYSDEVSLTEDYLIQQGVGEGADNKLIFALPGAAGNSQVRVKFRGEMNFYNLLLDDIAVIESPAHSMTIASDFYAIASSYKMPKYQIDTIRFLADVANIGAMTQNNVTLNVDVTNNAGTSVFTASLPYGTMNPGDTIENQLFSSFFVADTVVDIYTATYTLTSDSSASYPTANNIVASQSFTFEVTENEFSKGSNAANSSIAPGASNSWTFGTGYYVFNGTDIGGTNNLDTLARYASAITFGVANADDLAGQSVDVFLEKATDMNDNNLFEQGERTVVAFGTYTFQGNENDQIVSASIQNFAGLTDLYQLEPNTHYVVAVKYSAPNATDNLFALVSYAQNYSATRLAAEQSGSERIGHFLDIGNSTDYNYSTNFSGNPTPLVGLETVRVFTTSTSDQLLPENALTVFPNPADEFINANLALEKMAEEVTLTVYNVNGQVMETRNLSNVTNERVSFDLTNYTSGTYYMSIQTEAGHTLKRFIVAK